ncbi:MAG: isoprenyl transferase [Bacillota bacterium]|nr:isoprenyl transferase [Bacillota bacterium]
MWPQGHIYLYDMEHIMLNKDRMPVHVAVIMDGNGRWAKEKGVPRLVGHNAGMQAMKKIVDHSDKLGIKHLTVYAFSTENWKRSMEEVSGIFKLLVKWVASDLKGLIDNNVRVKVLGDYTVLPEDAVKSLEKTLEATKENTGLQFNIALNYGGRDEITRAVKSLAHKVKAGELDPEDITEDAISAELFTGVYNADAPDPELIIRTSGELRLSNFLLWQSAYSELVFPEVYWPDFTPEEFEKAIADYQSRERRFGGR